MTPVDQLDINKTAPVKNIAANKSDGAVDNTQVLNTLINKVQESTTTGEKIAAQKELIKFLNEQSKAGTIQISSYNKKEVSLDNGKTIVDISKAGIVYTGKEFTIAEKKEATDIDKPKYVRSSYNGDSPSSKVTKDQVTAKYKQMEAAYLAYLKDPEENSSAEEDFNNAYQDYSSIKEQFANDTANVGDVKKFDALEKKLFGETTNKTINSQILTDYQVNKKEYIKELQKQIKTLEKSISKTSNETVKLIRYARLGVLNKLLILHSSLLLDKNKTTLAAIAYEEGNNYSLLAAEAMAKNDKAGAYKYLGLAANKYLSAAEHNPDYKSADGKTGLDKAKNVKTQQKQIEAQLYQGLNNQLAKVKELEKISQLIPLKELPKSVTSGLGEEKTKLRKLEKETQSILGKINKQTIRGEKMYIGIDASGNDDRLYKQIIIKYKPTIDSQFIKRGLAITAKTKDKNLYSKMGIRQAAGDIQGAVSLAQIITMDKSNYSADQKLESYNLLVEYTMGYGDYNSACYLLGEMKNTIAQSKYANDQVYIDRFKYLELTAREGQAIAYDEKAPIIAKLKLAVTFNSPEDVDDVYRSYANIDVKTEFSAKVVIKSIEYYGRQSDYKKVYALINKLNDSPIGKKYVAEAVYTSGLAFMEGGHPRRGLEQFNTVLKYYPNSEQAELITSNYAKFSNYDKGSNSFDVNRPINEEDQMISMSKCALKVSQSYNFEEALAYTATGTIIGGIVGGPKGAAIGMALSQVVLVGKQLFTDWDKVVEAYQTGYNNISNTETVFNAIGLAIDVVDIASLGSGKALKTTMVSAKKMLRSGERKEAKELFKKATKQLIEHQKKFYANKTIKAFSVGLPIGMTVLGEANALATTGNLDSDIFKMLLTGKIVGKVTNKISLKLYEKKLEVVGRIKAHSETVQIEKNPIQKIKMSYDTNKTGHAAYEALLKAYPNKEIPIGIIKTKSDMPEIISPTHILDVSSISYEKRNAIHGLIQNYQNSGSGRDEAKFYSSIEAVLSNESELVRNDVLKQIKSMGAEKIEALVASDSCNYTTAFKSRIDNLAKNTGGKAYILHNHTNNRELSELDKTTGHGLIKKVPELGGGWRYELTLIRRDEKTLKIMQNTEHEERIYSTDGIKDEYKTNFKNIEEEIIKDPNKINNKQTKTNYEQKKLELFTKYKDNNCSKETQEIIDKERVLGKDSVFEKALKANPTDIGTIKLDDLNHLAMLCKGKSPETKVEVLHALLTAYHPDTAINHSIKMRDELIPIIKSNKEKIIINGKPITDKEIALLAKGCLLHDIGKLSLTRKGFLDNSTDFRKKPIDDPEAMAFHKERKSHPEKGMEILKKFGMSEELMIFALDHHELINGLGYPKGKKGADVSDMSQLITVLDIFNANKEARSYKPAKNAAEIQKIFDNIYSKGELDKDKFKIISDKLIEWLQQEEKE